MKSKRPNLVAGRLSADGPKSKAPDSPGADGSSAYGYERLGITSDAAQAGEGQPPESVAQVILTLPVVRPDQASTTPTTPSQPEPQIRPMEILSDPSSPPDDQPPVVTPGQWVLDLWDRYKDKAPLAGVAFVAVIILASILSTWGHATRSPVSPQQAVGADANQRLMDSSKLTEARKADEPSTQPQPKANVWEILSPIDKAEPPELLPSQRQGKEMIPAAATPPAKPASSTKPANSAKKYRQSPPDFVLAGVVRTADGLIANINGAFVPAGGIVNGAKVVEVREYSVEMELDGEYFLLGIGGAAPASPPSRAEESEQEEAPADHEQEQAKTPQAPTKDANTPAPGNQEILLSKVLLQAIAPPVSVPDMRFRPYR